MNLFITKKATVIYKVNSLLFFIALFMSGPLVAQEMHSLCFEGKGTVSEARQALGVLLLPKDIVELRPADNCLDIITSPDRAKLFEKYLSRRYDLKKDPSGGGETKPAECRLDLRTTKNMKAESSTLKMGQQNALSASQATSKSVSVMEMLIGAGVPSEFAAGEQNLKMTCHLVSSESANLIFSFTEKEKANVSTQVIVKRGEWLNVASVLKDLSDKGQTLGVPQTEINRATGNSETTYELQLK